MTTRDMNSAPSSAGKGAADMATAQRQRRPTPKREGPNRAVLAREDAVNGRAAAPVSDVPPAVDDAIIAAAVTTAYKVMEDNVEEGRRAAERLRAAAGPPSEPPPDAKAVANRLAHMTRQLGATWIELVAALLREPEIRAVVNRLTLHDQPRAGPAEPAGRTAPTSIAQRVRSRKPVEVTLSSLPPLNPAGPPGVAGLLSMNPASPALRQVAFEVGADGGLEIRIEVPDDQPADVYSGAVVDMNTRQPVGTLTIRVLE